MGQIFPAFNEGIVPILKDQKSQESLMRQNGGLKPLSTDTFSLPRKQGKNMAANFLS